jgi:hypothetical protein
VGVHGGILENCALGVVVDGPPVLIVCGRSIELEFHLYLKMGRKRKNVVDTS